MPAQEQWRAGIAVFDPEAQTRWEDAEFFYFRQDLRDYHDFILYHHFPPARNALACEAGGDESDEA
jgi:hypothetical protein